MGARAVAMFSLIGALVASECVFAALSCEQLFAVAQSVLRYRDQGYSLDQVLAALKTVDAEGKLTPGELDILRRAVTEVYLNNATPEQVALACVQTQGANKP